MAVVVNSMLVAWIGVMDRVVLAILDGLPVPQRLPLPSLSSILRQNPKSKLTIFYLSQYQPTILGLWRMHSYDIREETGER